MINVLYSFERGSELEYNGHSTHFNNYSMCRPPLSPVCTGGGGGRPSISLDKAKPDKYAGHYHAQLIRSLRFKTPSS